MITEYIHIPPPDKRYFIVYLPDKSEITYGELTNTSCALGYNYDNRELFEDKALWIARLLELGIEYIEGVEL